VALLGGARKSAFVAASEGLSQPSPPRAAQGCSGRSLGLLPTEGAAPCPAYPRYVALPRHSVQWAGYTAGETPAGKALELGDA